MAPIEPSSAPIETGNRQEVRSGASNGSNTAGGAPPPRHYALLIFFSICIIAAIATLVGVGMKSKSIVQLRSALHTDEYDFSNSSVATIQEWQSTLADHEAIAFTVAQCLDLEDLYFQPRFIKEQLMLNLFPNGVFRHYSEGSSKDNTSVNSNGKPFKLTSSQRAVIYLSNAISRARVEMADSVDDNYNRMKNLQIVIIIIGAITTLLISIKSMSNDNANIYFIIGLFAITFSSAGTAMSALNSFYAPREAYIRNQKSLSMLKQLHVEVAVESSNEMNGENCQSVPLEFKKQVKDWSTRLAAILNTPETPTQGEGKVTQITNPSGGNSTQPPAPGSPGATPQ
jgi:hypothetical protein